MGMLFFHQREKRVGSINKQNILFFLQYTYIHSNYGPSKNSGCVLAWPKKVTQIMA